MPSVGEAFVTIRPDTTGFSTAAETGIGGPMKKLALGIGALFAASKVKDWISSAIDEAQQAIKVEKQTEAVIRSTGGAAGVTAGQVADYAGRLSELSGIDDEVIQSGGNMLLTFKNIGSEIYGRTLAAVLDLAAGMAAASGGEVDLKGASIQLGKALNDPVQGMTALTRVGVQFSDGQKTQIANMVASGDLLGAQKIILQEVESQFKGSAAANATSADKMKVAYSNLKESIGKALIPIMNGLIDVLKPVTDWLAQNREAAIALAIIVGTTLTVAMLNYAVAAWSAAAGTIAATWPFLLLALAVAVFVGVLIAFATQWDAIWAWIRDNPVYAAIIAILITIINPFLWIAIALGVLLANWDEIWGWIEQATEDAGRAIMAVFNSIVVAFAGIWVGMKQIWASINGWLGGIPAGIINALGDMAGLLIGAGRAVIQGLWNGMRDIAGRLLDWVGNLASRIIDKVTGIFDVLSPSRVMYRIGAYITEGLQLGMESGVPGIDRATGAITAAAMLNPPNMVASAGGAGSTVVPVQVQIDIHGVQDPDALRPAAAAAADTIGARARAAVISARTDRG